MKAAGNNGAPERDSGQRPALPAASSFLIGNAVPLTVAVVATAAMAGGDTVTLWLRYDRAAILHGEIWRLFSAHLVHAGWSHLLMNLAGLVLIWLLFGRLLSTRTWVVTLALCALGVSLGLLAWQPQLAWYVGLSGVLHGMFVVGAAASALRGYRAELLLLVLLAAKLAWEHFHGALPGSESFAGAPVIVASHLYGALTGLLIAAALALSPRLSRRLS